MELKNRLGESESPYLHEAAQQPVCWQTYSDEVFKMATESDRPILLDIGAVWCHWCHVMDNESYSDDAVAELINKHFVPVKVDRDQMPDVDARYQLAIGALTGTGGWPLTGFLTPDGKVFFGGTYFPKTDIQGRQGLLTLLPQIAEAYAKRRGDVFRSAEEISQQLKDYEMNALQQGELGEHIIQKIVDDGRSRFDEKCGGFGSAPKFFDATVLQLFAEEAVHLDNPELRTILENTLDSIARGGVYDQIGGGFHRYSVDRYWHVPHFEKMLYDNALMLEVYLFALQLMHKNLYARISRETADWIVGTMRSPGGAFYSHQDADVSAHDDGTYWTWTRKEIEDSLTTNERKIVESYFDIREMPGDTPEFPERNVLRVAVVERDIATETGKREDVVEKLARSAKQRLLESRARRKAPFIDGTLFADRNGLAISALIEATLNLKVREYYQAAENAANFILKNMVDRHGKVAHAFSGKSILYQGLLDDQVYFGIALLDLFGMMRNDSHIDAAEKIGQVLLDEFEDRDAGGFFDRPSNSGGEGLLSVKKKPIEDAPTPSGNSGAAIFFDRLFAITENKKYFDVADRTLRAFAGSIGKLGIYGANYARAVRFHFGLMKNVR